MNPMHLSRRYDVWGGIAVVLILGWGGSVQAQHVPIYHDHIDNGKLTGGRILVDMNDKGQRATFGLDSLNVRGARGQWPVTTLVDSGPSANRIDLVVIGDGYTESELGLFATHTTNLLATFFTEEPLEAYATFFNIHRVDVTSNESGVDEPDFGIFRDTALDMTFNCSGIARLLCVDVGKAYAAAASAPDIDQVIVIANSERYGGAGYAAQNLGTLAGGNSSAVEIAIHEFGHSFADLADEYDFADGATYTGPEPSEPNVSSLDEATQLATERKWWRWMDLPNVSTYEGARYNQFGVFRPTADSIMRSLGRPFEQVNTEQFVRNFYQTVSPIDDATPSSGSPISSCTTFAVTPIDPVDHLLDIQWSVDGADQVGQTDTTFTPDIATLGAGLHTVRVGVTDSTDRVRDESLRSTKMTDSRQWQIEVLGSPLECVTPVPTVSEWGLTVMTLLVLLAGTLVIRA